MKIKSALIRRKRLQIKMKKRRKYSLNRIHMKTRGLREKDGRLGKASTARKEEREREKERVK